MPRSGPRAASRLERQIAQLSKVVLEGQKEQKEMRRELRQGQKEMRRELRKEASELQAQGVKAVIQLQKQGAQVVKQILSLGDQKFDEVQGELATMQGELATMNQTFTEVKTELTGLNSKLDRVLQQTSKGQVEEGETKMRLAKLETKERLNTMRLQNVLHFDPSACPRIKAVRLVR